MTTSRRSRSRARRSTEARDPSQVPAVAAMYGSDLFHLANGLDMGLEQPRPDRDSLWDWIVRDLPQSLSAFRMPQERHVKQVAEGGLRWVALTFSAGWGKDAERREQERLRDLIATYHKYGIQVLGYISMANVFARRVFKDIPGSKDWVQRDPEGEPIPYRGWKTETGTRVLACVNHPDFRAHQMDLVRRAMRFGCDGLLVDNVFGTCYCKHCRAAFREFARERMGTRRLLPLEDLETADWSRPVIRLAAEFFAESVQRFFARIRKAARRINRDAVCTMNVHPPRWRVRPTFDFPRLVRHCDIVISEDGALPASRSFKEVFETGQLQELSRSDLGRDNIDHYRYLRAVAKGRTFLFDAHHAWSVEPNHLKLALAEAFSCGGGLGFAVPPGYDPGRESLLKASGEYLTFFDEHRRLYEGASHVAQVAVLVSHRSMIWCLSRDERGRPNEPIRTATHLWGFSQALIYNNVPFDYVLEEDLSAKALSPYSVVILPNAVCLSDAALEAVNQFVRAGGSLVVTGETALYDENVQRRREYGLANLTGVRSRRWPGTGRVVRRILGKARVAHLVAPIPRDYLLTSDPRLGRELAAIVRWCAHGRTIIRLRDLPGVLVIVNWVPAQRAGARTTRNRRSRRASSRPPADSSHNGLYVCHFLNYGRYPDRDEPIERGPVEVSLDLAAWKDQAPAVGGEAKVLAHGHTGGTEFSPEPSPKAAPPAPESEPLREVLTPDRPPPRVTLERREDRTVVRLSRLGIYSVVVLEAAADGTKGGQNTPS